MIFGSVNFTLISGCTFTHDSGLANLGPSTGTSIVSIFGPGGGNFDNCTFNNLKGNYAGENYLFCRYGEYPSTSNGIGGSIIASNNGELTLRNCTFNFNSGSAGLMALANQVSNIGLTDTLLMDGCRINNSGGQQPLIWLNGNYTPGIFRFRANNYYNGALLNAATIATYAASGLIRLTDNATPVIVP
jgi:hypothetical protein